MKKILFSGITILLSLFFLELKAQFQPLYSDCSPLKFNGVAPAPWAIDGKMDDWETILGQGTGDPVFPFGPALGSNAFYDNYGDAEPQFDLRVLSNIRDDYNVYFYFRRLGKPNHPSKMFYFFDVNLNAALDAGEPVVCVNFKNSQKISSLAIGKYVPALNPSYDPISEDCVLSIAFSLKGNVTEFINSETITLLPNEKFEAAITEKGFGVEMAIPWRFINPTHKYFAFRTAMQSGTGMYSPGQPTDNAGCQNKVEIIGSPDFRIVSTTSQTITPGFSYRITVGLENLTPYTQIITLADSVRIKNIIQNNNLPVNETQFSLVVNNPANNIYNYSTGTFTQQPILFKGAEAIPMGQPQIMLSPFGGGSFTIDISFPPNGSVKSATIEFNPKAFFRYTPPGLPCLLLEGGGGKPTNPVEINLNSESRTITNNMSSSSIEQSILQNKVIVYPNPSKGSTNVFIPEEIGKALMTLSDYTGKQIKKWNGVQQRFIKIENLVPGFYLLNIRSTNGKANITKKIVIQ